MTSRGPVPKRSDQRRRANKPEGPDLVTQAPVAHLTPPPDLKGRHTAVAKRFWEALTGSDQSRFFQPSDWAAAELIVIAIDTYVADPTNASTLRAIQTGMSNLLVTEGDRRRARIELTPEAKADPAEEAADREITAFLEGAAAAAAGDTPAG